MNKKIIYILALATFFIGHSQNIKESDELEKQLQVALNAQLELLKSYNNQTLKEIELLQDQHGFVEPKTNKKNNNKFPLKENTNASVETIFGISDKEGLVNLTNFSIEIDNKKNKGLEMGLFIDINNIKIQEAKIPSKVFILNLGYTNQINFLSSKSRFITTRLIVGGSIGTEIINDGSEELANGAIIQTRGGLIYGGYIGAAVIFKISSSFSTIVRNSNFITTSNTSLYKFIIGAGLRFNF